MPAYHRSDAALAGITGAWLINVCKEGTATAEDIDTALRMGIHSSDGALETGDLTGWDSRCPYWRYLAQCCEKFRLPIDS